MPYNKRHIRNMVAYAKALEIAFNEAIKKAAALSADPSAAVGTAFDFSDNPALSTRLKAIFSDLQKAIEGIITAGVTTEWILSNNKNDALINSLVTDMEVLRIKPEWVNTNVEAMGQFINRSTDGLNLSERVWNLTKQSQAEIEMQLRIGINNGQSSARISQGIRQYLNNPDALFRKVRNEMGELEWSQAAKNFHPGQGVYRSAYKNAMRLAVTETNMAYRAADHLKWQNLDFVTGFKIMLSEQHPIQDICDLLEGSYPKEFLFVGWHPQCLCFAVAITIDTQEFGRYQDAILNGADKKFLRSLKMIKDVPQNFTTWVMDNSEKAQGWKNLPYFVRDNPQFAGAMAR